MSSEALLDLNTKVPFSKVVKRGVPKNAPTMFCGISTSALKEVLDFYTR
jgi:hypothetical protein